MREKIELYKARDLGDRINVTFSFIKQNGKYIARNFLYLIPAYIVSAIIMGTFQGSLYSGSYYGYSDYDALGSLGAAGAVMFASLIVGITSYLATLFVISYIAEYEESADGMVDSSKAWSRAKSSFWGGFGGSILVGIAVGIGLIFCIIPGIWLAVSFSLYLSIYIVERNKPVSPGIVDCISESYNLVKQDWFPSFGYYLVIGIIGIAFYFALYLPMMFVSAFVVLIPGVGGIFLMTIAYSLFYVGYLFLYSISSTATAMLYFDLKERREGLSLQKKIDNIGQPKL